MLFGKFHRHPCVDLSHQIIRFRSNDRAGTEPLLTPRLFRTLRDRYLTCPLFSSDAMTTLIRLGLSEHHRRGLVRVMREELTRTDDPQRVLGFARRWLYDHRLIIVHERRLRAMISTARRRHEAELGRRIADSVSTPEPCRPTPRRSTETRQQQSASVSWSQTTEIVGGRFQDGTPEDATG